MKKSTTAIMTAAAVLILIVAVILYMKPTATDQPVDQQIASVTKNMSETTNTTESNIDDTPVPDTSNKNEPKELTEEGEIDFNAEVYGDTRDMSNEVINPDGTITSDDSNGLSNPKSDPKITPIDPKEDPANQIYSATPETSNSN